jgi:CheY-like chemotaxis protein
VLQAIEDVAATVARLREFYRPREMQAALAPVHLNPLVEQVLALTRARWSDMPQQRGVVIQVEALLAPGLPAIMGSESELREALTNLVLNAVDAMPEGGTLTLRTSVDAHQVNLVVSDNGVGMDEETQRKCLEPFFTTKGERGTGLGLAMVYGIVKRHGANISILSTPHKGTDMTLTFAVPDHPAEAVPAAQPDTVLTGLRLLLIDDDTLLLEAVRGTLELDGHVITTATDGGAGVEIFRNAPAGEPFAAVITDLGMPRMDGRAVARAIKEISHTTPVILLTGWGQRPDSSPEMMTHIDRVVGKPPKLSGLRAALAQCCSSALPKDA